MVDSLGSCSLSLCLTAATAALAARPDASERKTNADASFDRRSYAQALEQYRAALALGGGQRIHYNVAPDAHGARAVRGAQTLSAIADLPRPTRCPRRRRSRTARSDVAHTDAGRRGG